MVAYLSIAVFQTYLRCELILAQDAEASDDNAESANFLQPQLDGHSRYLPSGLQSPVP